MEGLAIPLSESQITFRELLLPYIALQNHDNYCNLINRFMAPLERGPSGDCSSGSLPRAIRPLATPCDTDLQRVESRCVALGDVSPAGVTVYISALFIDGGSQSDSERGNNL